MTLGELLKQQIQTLSSLLELLQQEQALLMQTQPDGEQLNRLAEQKRSPLQILETLEQSRLSRLDEAGQSRNVAGSEAAAGNEGCLPDWQQVRALADKATYLNQLNGSLIQQRMRHTQLVLDDLWRITGRPLYGADGQQRPSSNRLQSRA